MSTKEQVDQAIVAAAQHQSPLTGYALRIPGLLTPFLRHLFNHLGALGDWLEVGTLAGASLVSAGYRNPHTYWAVDDFSYYADRPLKDVPNLRGGYAMAYNQPIHEAWQHHVALAEIRAQRLPYDWYTITDWPRVTTLYYDADHSYEATHDALEQLPKKTGARLVLLDDYNHPPIQRAVEHWSTTPLATWVFPTQWNGFYIALVSEEEPDGNPA